MPREGGAILEIAGLEFELCAGAGGITYVRTPPDFRKLIGESLPCDLRIEPGCEECTAHLERAAAYIAATLAGGKAAPPRVDLSGLPSFEGRALAAAMKIPRGEVRSYAWVAGAAGSPRGARAAGRAMSRNCVPLIVPCHRVVHSDGTPGGYGGGLDVKRKLLTLEGADGLVRWK